MSYTRKNKFKIIGRCKFCGEPVFYREVRNNWQKVHTSCAMQHPTDFKYSRDNFTLELRSSLLSPKLMQKIFKNL